MKYAMNIVEGYGKAAAARPISPASRFLEMGVPEAVDALAAARATQFIPMTPTTLNLSADGPYSLGAAWNTEAGKCC